jgi:ATP-dependent Zn protease
VEQLEKEAKDTLRQSEKHLKEASKRLSKAKKAATKNRTCSIEAKEAIEEARRAQEHYDETQRQHKEYRQKQYERNDVSKENTGRRYLMTGVMFLAVLVVLIIIIVMYWRRKRLQQQAQLQRPNPFQQQIQPQINGVCEKFPHYSDHLASSHSFARYPPNFYEPPPSYSEAMDSMSSLSV